MHSLAQWSQTVNKVTGLSGHADGRSTVATRSALNEQALSSPLDHGHCKLNDTACLINVAGRQWPDAAIANSSPQLELPGLRANVTDDVGQCCLGVVRAEMGRRTASTALIE